MIKVMLSAITLFPLILQANQQALQVEEIKNMPKREALHSFANRYLTFLNDASSCDKSAIADQVSVLCAPNCKKVLNGRVIFEKREYYAEQLADAQKAVGAWEIEPLDIFPSHENNAVVIRHLVHTEKVGSQIVLVILHCDSDNLICEINEVYNKFEG